MGSLLSSDGSSFLVQTSPKSSRKTKKSGDKGQEITMYGSNMKYDYDSESDDDYDLRGSVLASEVSDYDPHKGQFSSIISDDKPKYSMNYDQGFGGQQFTRPGYKSSYVDQYYEDDYGME